MTNKRTHHIAPYFIPAIIFLLIAVSFAFSNHATAEEGDLNNMTSYESVLIRDGDTLSSIAETYADVYSHDSSHEYMNAIMSLNNLSSEHINSGTYILLPRYR